MLSSGTLPGICAEHDAALRARDLRSYADTDLREEVQAEALVRDIGGFARLLDLFAASSGRIVNTRALSQDVGLGYETVRRYLAVLEDTLVAFRVPAWSGSDRTSLVAHPKHYLFDLGVRNALLRRPLDRPLDDERGLLFEHFVAGKIHRRCGTLWPEARLFHYRTRHGAEVDFLLEVGRDVWAIEVKAGDQLGSGSLAGLRSAAERVPRITRKIVLFTGARAQRIGDVEVLPYRKFLAELPC